MNKQDKYIDVIIKDLTKNMVEIFYDAGSHCCLVRYWWEIGNYWGKDDGHFIVYFNGESPTTSFGKFMVEKYGCNCEEDIKIIWNRVGDYVKQKASAMERCANRPSLTINE